jgi:hypothetical protein
MIKLRLALIGAIAAMLAAGCSVKQPDTPPPVAQFPVAPLPFRGQLTQGDPNQLPPSVALSLTKESPIQFSYREELTHDEYHIPRVFTALDPVTYVGAPLGDYGVTAFASLTITQGDKVLGDYTAKAHVSKSYTLYSEPTHAELDDSARAAVRQKIDDQLYRDRQKLAEDSAAPPGRLAE